MNDSTGGDGGRRGRRRSATGAREDSRNVSVRLGTRNRASSSRTEPACLESGRAPTAFSAHTKILGSGVFGGSRRTRGKDERETHLRLFGVGGAARHQKGVALFRVRHARGSGHRRRSAQVTRTRLERGYNTLRLQTTNHPFRMKLSLTRAFVQKMRLFAPPSVFLFLFWKKMKRKAFFVRVAAHASDRAYASAVALVSPFFFFPPSARHMASAPIRLTKPSTKSFGSGCHPAATSARNAKKTKRRPTTVDA